MQHEMSARGKSAMLKKRNVRKISEKKENHEIRKTKKQIKSEGPNWKKCTMKKLQHKRVLQEKICIRKEVQHEKSPTQKKVQREKSATRKKGQHENSAT